MPDSPSVARCVVRHLDELFLEETIDPDVGRVYRPYGRAVEDDEDPEAAVRAVFADDLAVDLSWVTQVGRFGGTAVFEASADQSWLYDEDGFTVYDPETGETTRLAWLHVEDFRKYGETLRPEGLLDALTEDDAENSPA